MAAPAFRLLLISPPAAVPGEGATLRRLFEAGLATLHLRKPGASAAELRAYLTAVPREFHGRIVLHAHHALAAEFGVGGLHLPAARRPGWRPPAGGLGGRTLSTSLHSLAELRQHRRRYDYVFLSPIFDSLSKASYAAGFELPTVQQTLAQLRARPGYAPRAVALGGITRANLAAVQLAGFVGAAVLGAVWQASDPLAAFRALQAEVPG